MEQTPPNDEQQPQQNKQSRPPVEGVPSAPPPPPPGYVPPAYAPPPRGGGVLQRVAMSLIATVLIVSLLLNIYFAIIFAAQFQTGVREAPYAEGSDEHKVVIVEVKGMIDSGMAEYLRETFEMLKDQPPQAVVMRVDSGGGGVTASDQIWHYLEQFKAEHENVPVVASFGQVAASGGYYIAAPADHIVCETTGITGSIGVMAQAPTLGGLMDKVGVKWETMVADGSPDKAVANNIYRDWTEADRAVFKRLLNSAHTRFVEVVAQGRASVLSEDEVKALASGDIFTASEAEANKLIDQVGYLGDAIDKAADLAGVPGGQEPTVTIVRRPQPLNVLAMLGANRTASVADASRATPEQVRSWLNEFTAMRLEYRHPW
jgi:protease-4